MLFEALRFTLSGMLRIPVLWLAGLFLGFFVMGDLLLEYYGGFFLAGKLWIIGIIILPLFIAGMLHSIKSGDRGFGPFFREGMKRYFRVLLPGIIILFVALVTIGLIILGLTLIGVGPGSGVIIIPIAGVIIPFIFFTIFYDTVAVFEDKPAFESIRRSVEIVLSRPGPVLVFFISILIVVFGVTFLLLIIWSSLLFTRLEPLTTLNATQIEALTPDAFLGLLGTDGIWITAILVAAGLILLVTFCYVFKAYVYRAIAPGTIVPEQESGEYDSKGRWYKY
jgi:hypothetical protein